MHHSFRTALSVVGIGLLTTHAIAADNPVTLSAEGMTFVFNASSRSDALFVRDLLSIALQFSTDMKAKIRDLPNRYPADTITINVGRRIADVDVGEAQPATSSISIDLQDLSSVTNHLEGTAEDVAAVTRTFLFDTLAHEIDHLRDGRHPNARVHVDPPNPKRPRAPAPPNDSVTGPPVDDANRVLRQIASQYPPPGPNIPVQRTAYARVDNEGNKYTPYSVDGRAVLLNMAEFLKDIRTSRRSAPSSQHLLPDLSGVPDRPCTDSVSPCYVPACTFDADCDSIPDVSDNCPGLANPQQSDPNGNGIGQGCDATEPQLVCDADFDGDVDRADLAVIFAARNTTATDSDPRDPDVNGVVNVNDVRVCVLRCTRPECRTE